MANTSSPQNLPNFNVPLTDAKTGVISQAWMRFFLNLWNRTGGSPGGGSVPAGGTAGQVLTKVSSNDFDDTWTSLAGIGVSSFNTRIGAVTLISGDVTSALGYTPGTVNSVAMTGDGTVFNATVPGSPITSSGTLLPSLHVQSPNTALLGPTSGSAVAPTFRAITLADLPTTVTYTVGSAGYSGQGAGIGTTILYNAAATAGLYLINLYTVLTTAGSGGTLAANLNWTDDHGLQTSSPISSFSLSVLGGFAQSAYPIEVSLATNISFSTTLTGATGNPAYSFYIAAELIAPFVVTITSFHFETVRYTGTGGSLAIILSRAFKPDLVVPFTTAASGTGIWWPAYDSVRGATKYLDISNNGGQATAAQSLVSFDTSGFTLGSSSISNNSTTPYQAFCWKIGGGLFDVQGYSGNSTARTLSHTLGAAPQMMLVADYASGADVFLYHAYMDATSPQNVNMHWSAATVTTATNSTIWNNVAPTSLVFSLGTDNSGGVNTTGQTYVNYLFGQVAGQSNFGSYVGNGSTSGPSINCGFPPSLVMVVKQSASGNDIYWLYGNTAEGRINRIAAEQTTNFINFTASGFMIVTTDGNFNTNGATYLFSAWL